MIPARDIDDDRWKIAVARERVIRDLAGRSISRSEAEMAAKRLGESVAYIYRLRRRYEADPRTQSLAPEKGGRRRGARLLSPETEAIISAVIETYFASPQKPTVSAAHREIGRLCRLTDVPVPSLKAVRARIQAHDQIKLSRKREGAAKTKALVGPVKGELSAERPLKIVQIDHTLVDVIVVDDEHRQPIGRPWLTLVIDVHTRMVLGFLLSLEPPSRLSVALAITHAVSPKKDWLFQRNITDEWPCRGLFETIKLDNAKEFHAKALKVGCEQYGMRLEHRPPGAPWFGGHVERLLGTLMKECHLLPGATFSNPQMRGVYNSERKATMTRAELEGWLAGRIAGVYHHRIHASLGCSPFEVWQRAERSGWSPREVLDQKQFLLDFLPFELRMPRRDGLRLFNIQYWHPNLAFWAAQKPGRLPVRYDPRDLSRVWLESPDGTVEELRFKQANRPAITLWEHRAAQAAVKAEQEVVSEDTIFAAIEDGRQRVERSEQTTKATRRQRQRLADAGREENKHSLTDPSKEAPPDDYIPTIYDTEYW